MENTKKRGASSVVSIRENVAPFEPENYSSCIHKCQNIVKKRLPILSWMPQYKKSYLLADMIAGITVWLTAVPQSIAYAAIVGLSPEYGLYSQFLGPIAYVFLGSCRQVTIGPTAVLELLTFQKCGESFPECVILMGFYSGIVEFILGLLNLGLVISFISEPVTVGFTAGAACTIASAQIKNIFGLRGKSSKRQFIYLWQHIVEEFSSIKLGDTVLGLICIMILILFQKIKDLKAPSCCSNPDVWIKVWGTLALARNALVVSISSLIAFAWPWSEPPFALTGTVQKGFPPIALPSFELWDPHNNSTTATEPMSFTETLNFLGTAPMVIAFIAILQNVAISKSFGSGQTIDGTQEMIALGTINIIGGFFSCIPVSGSCSRSVVNDESGVKSQLGGLFVGVLILLSLGFLTPLFQYIPKASLAAVVICAVILIIRFDKIFLIWKTSKVDFLCFLVTYVSSLALGMALGMLVGMGVSIAIILLKSLRPSVSQEVRTDEDTGVKYILLKPDQGFYFPSVDFIRDSINQYARQYSTHSNIIVIKCDKWTKWDYTAVSSIISLAKSLRKTGTHLVLYKHPAIWDEALKKFREQYPTCCSQKTELHDYFKEIGMKEKSIENKILASRPPLQIQNDKKCQLGNLI